MSQTINKSIGGLFDNRSDADKAVAAFTEMQILPQNIRLVVQLSDDQVIEAYKKIVADRFSEEDVDYYDRMLKEGKFLVVVDEVSDPAAVIDVFNKFHCILNPDGSRNVRDDVVGMTVGAMVGATALGVAGAVLAGPIGAAAGAAAGAVIGGGSGAVAGNASEHNK